MSLKTEAVARGPTGEKYLGYSSMAISECPEARRREEGFREQGMEQTQRETEMK